MTTQNPLEREPPPGKRSVSADGANRELGARGGEAAGGPSERRDGSLVKADGSDHPTSEHRSSVIDWSSSLSLRCPTPYASRRALTNTSSASPSSLSRGSTRVRPSSRRRRLTRFRSTMECPCLGTMMPQRLRAADEDKKKTSKLGVFFLDPSLRRDRMSRVLWIRPERGKRKPPPPRLAPAAEWAAIIRLFRADLHNEAGASSGPPPGKRFSPAASLHAFPETVLVYALPIPWPVCGLHYVLAPMVVVPRPHREAAQRKYSTLRYPSVSAPVKVGDPAKDPASLEGKLTFPHPESSVLSRRYFRIRRQASTFTLGAHGVHGR